MNESIGKSGSSFYGLNSPTLKVASSNLVSRTKKSVSRQGCGLFDMVWETKLAAFRCEADRIRLRGWFNLPWLLRFLDIFGAECGGVSVEDTPNGQTILGDASLQHTLSHSIIQ